MRDEESNLVRVVAAVLCENGKFLITQRNPCAVFPLYWEFPGGKVEPGETDEAALVREIREELGAEIEVLDLLERRVHCYEDFSVDFRAYNCTLKPGSTPKPIAVNDMKWVAPEEFENFRFPPADESAIALLAGLGKGCESPR